MKLYSFLFAVALLFLNVSAIAQTVPIPSNLKTIPLDDAELHLIEHDAPTYPPIAKLARVEGAVRLTLEVNQRGEVVRVVGSAGPALLKQAAAEAAEHFRYRPFEVNGALADVLVEAVVNFSLHVPVLHVPFPDVTNINSVVMEYNDGYSDIRVHGGGIVEYDGTGTGVVEGKHQRQITPDEVQQLLNSFRNADFFSLNDDYSVAAMDAGSEETSIQIGHLRKSVTDNLDVPAVLKSVQGAILKYSHSDQWLKGNQDTVPGLLAETSDPDRRREVLSEVLPRAALYSDMSVIRVILSNPVDLNRKGPFDATALILAADRGSLDIVSALLRAGADPHAVDNFGRNALIFGAASGNVQVVKLLLQAGLKANSKDRYGDTALMAAAASGNPESVSLLLKNGAAVNAKNCRCQTALLSGATGDSGFCMIEDGRSHPEVPEELIHRDTVVDLLLNAGGNPKARGWDGETALFSLDDNAVRELVRHHINLEARDKFGQTALIETVSDSVADILLKAGADVNAQDKDGNTALIDAAENNYVHKLKVLVKAPGIDLEKRDNKGQTALMKAKAKNLPDSVRVLVSAGATQ